MLDSDLLAPFGDAELIPLVDVAERVGLNRGTQHYAVQNKVIIPAEKRGPHGRYLVSREEALLILAAGLVALAVGATVVTVLRTLRETGARVVNGTMLAIPLTAAA